MDGHIIYARHYLRPNNLESLQNTDWSEYARQLAEPLDERLLYKIFNRTVNTWLSIAIMGQVDRTMFRPAYGLRRKTHKIPIDLLWKFLTFSELQSIFLLVLVELFSNPFQDKISRFEEFITKIDLMNLGPEIKTFLKSQRSQFALGSHDFIQKSLDRTRVLLLKNGFSHIRVDFISANIRLCPITKDFDTSAALYMSQQPQEDVVNEQKLNSWQSKFGMKNRGFFEIPLDSRVAEHHKKIKPHSNHLTIKRRVNSVGIGQGIILLPQLSDILISDGFAFVLFNQDVLAAKT